MGLTEDPMLSLHSEGSLRRLSAQVIKPFSKLDSHRGYDSKPAHV